MIVALGESIVAIGIGAAGLPVDLTLASVAVLGLLLAACLWWAYFGGDDARAERALVAVADDRRGWVAVQAFGYWHLLMLGGIIALAAGLKDVVGHAFEPLDLAHALLLSGARPCSWPATSCSAAPSTSAPATSGLSRPSSPWPPSPSA